MVGRVPDDRRATDVPVALDDDGEEGAEHDNRLECVGPHDRFNATLQSSNVKFCASFRLPFLNF